MRFRLFGPSTVMFGIALFALLSLGVDSVTRQGDRAVGETRKGWDWVTSTAEGAWTIVAAAFHSAAQYPSVWALLAAVVLVVACLRAVARASAANAPRDPQRMFTREQRLQASERSGGQCEMEGWLWFRCKRPGEHGDHFFPWSLGGETSQANHVWACAPCNLSKGAKVPTLWQKVRLERRRRKYFPENIPVEAGSRYNDIPH